MSITYRVVTKSQPARDIEAFSRERAITLYMQRTNYGYGWNKTKKRKDILSCRKVN